MTGRRKNTRICHLTDKTDQSPRRTAFGLFRFWSCLLRVPGGSATGPPSNQPTNGHASTAHAIPSQGASPWASRPGLRYSAVAAGDTCGAANHVDQRGAHNIQANAGRGRHANTQATAAGAQHPGSEDATYSAATWPCCCRAAKEMAHAKPALCRVRESRARDFGNRP